MIEQQIISAVRAMREAQKEYFRIRDVNVLRRSKAAHTRGYETKNKAKQWEHQKETD